MLSINWTYIENGLLISVVGYVVVLLALALLYYVFQNLPRLLHWQMRWSLRRQGKDSQNGKPDSITADETAAIAAAIYLFFNEVHDDEHATMTIRKISKTYSPWSSKIFSVMNPTWRRRT
jgi:Na+-transporting methylmalonyl-CoA/oxaloacetate decarboxylase gamma subunit